MANQLKLRLKYSISGKNSNFKTIEEELQFSNKNFKCAKQRRRHGKQVYICCSYQYFIVQKDNNKQTRMASS